MKYVIYSRKSSEEKTKQVQSVESQIVEMKRIAERDNLSIVKIFREEKSAKKPGRPVFSEMIKFIEDKHADAILCWKLDRLARNPADEGMVKWMLQQGIIKQIKTNDRDYKPDDNVLLSSVEFGMANQYILDLSKNVRRGQKAKLEKGGWPNMAPLGYKNENSTIVLDKNRTKYIRKAFELSATGGYSVKDIANILFAEGFRSRAGIKYHKSRIHKLLHNPFYYGVMKLYGLTQHGNHEPIISKELFDKVQLVLQGKHHSKRKKHFFALRGYLKCEVCGCLMTATLKKGHQYYYCTNGKGNCVQHKKYLRSEELDKTLAGKFQDLKFNPKLVEIAYKAAKEKTNQTKTYLETARADLTNRLNALKTKQERLLDVLCEGSVASAVYKARSSQMQKEEIDLETQLNEINKNIQRGISTLEQTKKVFLEANSGANEFLEAKDERKRKLLEILLWNATFQNQELAKVSYKMPYQYLADEPEKGDFFKLRCFLIDVRTFFEQNPQ